MPREAEFSLNERTFILQALQRSIRLDDRALDAYRPLGITLGEDYGTADIQLGKTRYIPSCSFSDSNIDPPVDGSGTSLTSYEEFLPVSPPASPRLSPTESSTAFSPLP
jgi:exosome complex component RRP45